MDSQAESAQLVAAQGRFSLGKLLYNSRLKDLTYVLVIQRAAVQQLERRGKRIVTALFEELSEASTQLVSKDSWDAFDGNDTVKRRVCDYIAGMTDHYAEKIYGRLFIPGEGSSHDEL